jgi:putative ABC transport system permease protein
MINVFSYGFIIMISLIAVANVFNTISTSISLRKRELAMLRSIGMDNRRFNKMMGLECLFYGLKALVFSLPVSVGINFLIWWAVVYEWERVGFMFPTASVLISVFSVFFVVFVTTVYAVSRLRRANVIDALREESV